MTSELKIIKKYYGESMSHLLRELFPTILEEDGTLLKILLNNFNINKYLYKDIVDNDLVEEFKNYIYSKYYKNEIKEINSNKTPSELMNEAGYDLFECHTEEDIQRFKKYYAKNEELCTFKGGRLDKSYVFFGVKKDIDKIKREDFLEPKRQDLYGTSVISIQFTRGSINTLSIKNRYNHRVINPDATFSNNLENIIPGLTNSFEKTYSFNINYNKCNLSLLDYKYTLTNQKKYYRYNYEINGIYYCPNNIIIDHGIINVTYSDKSKYLLIDYYILDLQNKKIFYYDESLSKSDYTINTLKEINKIEITKEKNNNKKIKIYLSNYVVEIGVDELGNVISYRNNVIKKAFNFFRYNITVKELEMNNLEETDNFFKDNMELKILKLPKLKIVGHSFFSNNMSIRKVDLPNLKVVGNGFMSSNTELEILNLPNLNSAGSFFFFLNDKIKQLYVPKLRIVGHSFLANNLGLVELDMPSLEIASDLFIGNNVILNKVNLPKLKIIENNFLLNNKHLEEINLPSVVSIEGKFLYNNVRLRKLYVPKLKQIIGNSFLYSNKTLKIAYMPSIEEIGSYFLYNDKNLEIVIMPNLKKYKNPFLLTYKILKIVNLPFELNSDDIEKRKCYE